MSYKDFKAPPLGGKEIKIAVEKLRDKHCKDELPVDVEALVERRLKIVLVPLPNLIDICGSEALITSNWEEVYLDEGLYLDERYERRIRFSLAHELGHLILHKTIYEALGIKTIEDLIKFISEVPQDQYNLFEVQAHKFASHLLIPRDSLAAERDRILKEKSLNMKSFDRATLDSFLAIPLADIYNVSQDAVEVALKDRDLNNF